MTVFDYLLKNCGGKIYKDEYGNVYIEGNSEVDFLVGVIEVDIDTYMVSKEIYGKYSEIEITITDDESVNEIKDVRRPYYRMRGKPVTKEQAFEIIRRTDNFFYFEIDEIQSHVDFIKSINFDNWLISRNHSPQGYGWIHTDGTVGINSITQKYPSIYEFVMEWTGNLVSFPYLDLIIAVTYWDEVPIDEKGKIVDREVFESGVYDKKFLDSVIVGIYIHNNKVEILSHTDAVKKYKEYDDLYGQHKGHYEPSYYENNDMIQVDYDYLQRCIEAYGYDAKSLLSKVSEYKFRKDNL